MSQNPVKSSFIPGVLMPIIGTCFQICASRTVLLLFATTFSIVVILLLTGIMPIKELQDIFGLSDNTIIILEKVLGNMRQVCSNIAGILSQLLNKFLDAFGSHTDLSKINVDVNQLSKPTP